MGGSLRVFVLLDQGDHKGGLYKIRNCTTKRAAKM